MKRKMTTGDRENRTDVTMLSELLAFLKQGKRWWLTPVLLVLGILALFAFLAGAAPVLPFIYTLF